MEGAPTYYGFAETATEPEVKVVINAVSTATSPPQYWHRVDMMMRGSTFILGRGRPSGRGNVSTEKSLTS